MDAGQLRERVTLQTAVNATDEGGGRGQTWAGGTEVWARVAPVQATELTIAGALQGRATYKVTIRWRTGVAAAGRVVRENGVVLEVLSVLPRERRDFIDILCQHQRQGVVT